MYHERAKNAIETKQETMPRKLYDDDVAVDGTASIGLGGDAIPGVFATNDGDGAPTGTSGLLATGGITTVGTSIGAATGKVATGLGSGARMSSAWGALEVVTLDALHTSPDLTFNGFALLSTFPSPKGHVSPQS